MKTLTLLQSAKFKLGDNYLEVSGTVDNSEWVSAFKDLTKMSETCQWWIGDLLNLIEASGKDILTTLGNEVGYDHRSMLNMKSISKKIPKDKRVDGVSWSHHREAFTATKNLDAMVSELESAKDENKSVLSMRDDIREKLSDKTKTIIPAITRSNDSVLFTEALNGCTAIKRFANNVGSKLTPQQKQQFMAEFNDMVEIVEEEIK